MMSVRTKNAMVLGLLAMAIWQQPDRGAIAFFDRTGQEVTVAYEGGRIMIPGSLGQCDKLQLIRKDTGNSSDKVVDEKDCDSQSKVTFSLKIEKGIEFGVYVIHKNGVDSTETFVMEYFLSGNGSNDCGKLTRQCANGSYCVIRSTGAECSNLSSLWCTRQHKETGFFTCKGDLSSLCNAIAHGIGANAVVELQDNQNCPSSNLPRMVFKGDDRKLSDYIGVDPTNKTVMIYCPSHTITHGSNLRCNVTKWDGQEIGTFNKDSCIDHFQANIPDNLFDHGWQVYNMYCQFENTKGDVVARMRYNLVVLGNATAKCTTQPSTDGKYTKSVTCEAFPQPSPEFNIGVGWFSPKLNLQGILGNKLGINVDDTIQAEVTAEFISYNPFDPNDSGFKATTPKSQPVEVKAEPAMSSTSPLHSAPSTIASSSGRRMDENGGLPWWVLVLIGVIGVILLTAIVIAVICMKRRSSESPQPKHDLKSAKQGSIPVDAAQSGPGQKGQMKKQATAAPAGTKTSATAKGDSGSGSAKMPSNPSSNTAGKQAPGAKSSMMGSGGGMGSSDAAVLADLDDGESRMKKK